MLSERKGDRDPMRGERENELSSLLTSALRDVCGFPDVSFSICLIVSNPLKTLCPPNLSKKPVSGKLHVFLMEPRTVAPLDIDIAYTGVLTL